ncbi:cupin domain-containing protein [Isoptericola sp. b441]|uniref:Cupin domain-containing protein n=1 Tax=Actinotalea lenta TaxID=3064654 RepID=A0ABT9DDC9_9CELL|nr:MULTISPECIES: cupin domain-containing protein [unclassified Isoptericola]MDO8108384.1 cupin domain-containing protein [Isoptericola sp. b441]MDO8119802.1 cupin domain-containing protein [Isoptericola sp. b490]
MAARTHQDDIATEVFDWGSIKWGVTDEHFPEASLTVGEVVINPTFGHDVHTHPDSDEVLYIIEGEGEQTVADSGKFPVRAGDSIYIPRGVEHSTFNTGWKQLRLLAVYNPGGSEKALRSAPDYARLEPGSAPVWVRG